MERQQRDKGPISRRQSFKALAIGSSAGALAVAEAASGTASPVQAQTTGGSWGLTGNSATDPSTHFVGTVDNQPLVVRTSNTERLRISAPGDVGIGTNSPNGKLSIVHNGGTSPKPWMLHIRQTSSTGVNTNANALLRFEHSNGANSRDWLIGTGSATLFGHPDHFGIHDTVSGTAFTITQFGNVGVGTASPGAKLDVAGDIWARDVVLTSDARFKTNVQQLTGTLEKVQQIRGVSFAWRDAGQSAAHANDDSQFGLIAQEVEAVFPELVTTHGNDGYKGVNYIGLIGVLVETSKELAEQNQALQHQHQLLTRRIGVLEHAAMGAKRRGR